MIPITIPKNLRQPQNLTLIHHQGVIYCVAYDRFSLRRTVCTAQSALLPHKIAGSTMWRLVSDTLLVPRVSPKTLIIIDRQQI
jgi:hypothetical protein